MPRQSLSLRIVNLRNWKTLWFGLPRLWTFEQPRAAVSIQKLQWCQLLCMSWCQWWTMSRSKLDIKKDVDYFRQVVSWQSCIDIDGWYNYQFSQPSQGTCVFSVNTTLHTSMQKARTLKTRSQTTNQRNGLLMSLALPVFVFFGRR